MAKVTDVLEGVRDTITVRRVFGNPIRRGGTTVVPAASVMGGGGGGEGGEGANQGTGTGFGVRARPVGAYVIREGEVTWRPAFDPMRAVVAGMLFAAFGTMMASRAMRRRARTAAEHPHGTTPA